MRIRNPGASRQQNSACEVSQIRSRIQLKILMRIRIQIQIRGRGRSAKNVQIVHPPWQNPRYAPVSNNNYYFLGENVSLHWHRYVSPSRQYCQVRYICNFGFLCDFCQL